ncbi:MAG: serine hydrolase domain-containing protein [Pseudomonadales bacterium]
MTIVQDLPKLLRAGIKKYHIPGASIAILRNNRVLGEAAAGVINLDTRVPTTTDTIFQIGSISKPFTTTLIMQLVDEGKVELDAPIVEYLPKFRVADLGVSRQVTVRHFLSHQSGIDGDFFVDSGRGDDCIEKLVSMATMVPSLFPLEAKHSYCNLGFAVLGRVIEVLTRQTFDTVLQQRIFEPLGMSHAISLPEDTLRFRCVIGHVPSRKKNVWYTSRVPFLSHGQKAAGATPAMSSSDLLKFAQMHMIGGRNPKGERILSNKSVKAMQRKQINLQKHSRGAVKAWGLGWFLMDWRGHSLYGHDGATIGQFSYLRILPEKNIAVALLTNGGDAQGLSDSILRDVFQGLAKISEPESAIASGDLKVAKADFTGSYSNMGGRLQFDEKAGKLTVTSFLNGGGNAFPDKSKLSFIDRNTAVMATGNEQLDRMKFLFSDKLDGKFQFVNNRFRQHKRG